MMPPRDAIVKVVVLGGSGMLGAMTVDLLSRNPSFAVVATVRSLSLLESCRSLLPEVEWRLFDADSAHDPDSLRAAVGDARWIINAIGITKPHLQDGCPEQCEIGIRINARFPYRLAALALETGAEVLQIATDCVYSGVKGHYVESDPHDALDVYGKTKSLGEAEFDHLHRLRCSIIGPEPKSHVFLLDWFRLQKENAALSGFRNHQWNGLTTLHFARLCEGIIARNLDLPRLIHVVPEESISKEILLRCFARHYNRTDISIASTEAKTVIDRTLATLQPDINREVWSAAGYGRLPSVPDMVGELAAFHCRLKDI